jgi:gliding motility-associated-like protein
MNNLKKAPFSLLFCLAVLPFTQGQDVGYIANPTTNGAVRDNGTLYNTVVLGGFTYIEPIPPPTITLFSPISGAFGATIIITGTNFDATPANNVVIFGATRATVTTSTTTQLTVTVPVGATYAPITVLNTTLGLLASSTANFTPIFTPNKGSISAIDFPIRLDLETNVSSNDGVAIGDLDGDGKADLAVASYGLRKLIIFKNTSAPGAASFAPKMEFDCHGNTKFVTIGDLDADGKADIAVGADYYSIISIYRNTSTPGTINFDTRIALDVGALGPNGISIADLDSDGKMDLAVALDAGAKLAVYRNTGSVGTINFATRQDFATSTRARSVSIGDLDGDGKVDVAISNLNNKISTFRNTSTVGTISFATRIDFAALTGYEGISIADLDADGKAEIISTGSGFSVLRNIGSSGNIRFAPYVPAPINAWLNGITVGDLDGDGKPDVVAVSSNLKRVFLFRNTCNSGVISFANYVELVASGSPRFAAVGDLDGDGKADIAASQFFDATNASVFINNPVYPPPTVTSLTPTSAGAGATVTLTGTNLTGATAVSFGGIAAASFTVVSATSITAVVSVSTVSGDVSVTTPGGVVTKTGFVFVPAPSVTSFTPTSAGAGATVTITGINLTGATAVSFGGIAATSFTVVSATSITAVVSVSTVSGDVSVTTPGGIANKTGFVFVPAPTITSFTPTSAGAGSIVTLTGTNFTGATAVSFGGIAATSFTVVSATSITAVVAASAASGAVSVTTSGGIANKTGFIFVPAPTITSFTPTSAGAGATVTITGTNLTGATAVSFGVIAATSFTVVSATSITAVVAASAVSGDVSVTTSGGVATKTGFVFIPAPTITSFTPTSAGVRATVTITGTNLSGASVVSFGGVAAASFNGASATTINATVATGATGNVLVTTSGGTATKTGFTFVAAVPGVKDSDYNSGNTIVSGQSQAVDMGKTSTHKDLFKTFSISNTGSSPLEVLSLVVSNPPFTIVEAPTSVAANSFGRLTLKLNANSVGVYEGKVTLTFKAGIFEFNVKGEVKEPNIQVYNAVTPNGDGAHDFLKIVDIESYPNNQVTILNRWGAEVYKITGYNNSQASNYFSGQSNVGDSQALADGTYFYVIDVGTGSKYTGFLLLQR